MNLSVVFMGLFLMGFALYGSVLSQLKMKTTLQTEATHEETEAVLSINTKLEKLYQKISSDGLFKQERAQGIDLKKSLKTITLVFYGDEVYEAGAFAMNESWLSALDRLKEYIEPELEHGLRVQIKGYADEQDPKEKASSDYGESDLTFSFARAEWVARYFERKWGFSLRRRFELVGVGARAGGRKTELILSYGQN